MRNPVGITFSFLSTIIATWAFAAYSFTLKDQFGRSHSKSSIFKDKPLVLIAGDKLGTDEMISKWEKEVRRLYNKRVNVFGLANLDPVPFFISDNHVLSVLKKNCSKVSVLCDWDGTVYEKLEFPTDGIWVGIFNQGGQLLKRVAAKPVAQGLAKLSPFIEQALD